MSPGTPLPTRALPRAGKVQLSILGFGAAPLGNFLAAMTDAEAEETLDVALDEGVCYVDTAPYYGYGLSERRIGAVLSGRGARSSISISTKAGRLLRPRRPHEPAGVDGFVDTEDLYVDYDYTRAGVLRSVESSLRRLGTETLDIVLLHDLGADTHGSDAPAHLKAALDEGFPALAALKASGAIGGYGIGVNEEAVCHQVLAHADLDCIMLAGRYTLLEQGPARTLLPLCARRQVGLIAAGPYNSGILAGDRAPLDTYNYAAAPEEVRARAERLYEVCRSHGVDGGAAAVQFPLGDPAVVSVVAGARSAEEARTATRRMRDRAPAALWSDLRSAGLIEPGVATPS